MGYLAGESEQSLPPVRAFAACAEIGELALRCWLLEFPHGHSKLREP